jgi:hypothetical protein
MTVHHRFPIATITAIVTIVACSFSRPTAAQENDTAVLRIRSSDASITRLIELAIARSPTFKRLVATVEASNGIIYVEPGVCTGRVRSCLPIWISSGGPNRFMRIVVDRRRLDSDAQLIGAVGHELQHATEVLDDPRVTNSTQMYFFYLRQAPTGRDRFETLEAINAGIVVDREFRTWRRESTSGDGQSVPNPSTARLLATSITRAN